MGRSLDGDLPALPKHVHIPHPGAVRLGEVVPVLVIKITAQAFDFVLVGVGQGDVWGFQKEKLIPGPSTSKRAEGKDGKGRQLCARIGPQAGDARRDPSLNCTGVLSKRPSFPAGLRWWVRGPLPSTPTSSSQTW